MATSFFSLTTYSSENIPYIRPTMGNYNFDTSLTAFGLMRERKIRKVNRKSNLLKLIEVKDTNSIYPMIDEFGYTYQDFFIFKSSWDLDYYTETIKN